MRKQFQFIVVEINLEIVMTTGDKDRNSVSRSASVTKVFFKS